MNATESKELIAAYLTGKRVSAKGLQRAYALLCEDELAIRALVEELSGGEDVCERHRQNLAEFSELSLAERRREMPQLMAHLEACDDCRQAYWEVRPVWRVAAQAAAVGQTISKELIAGLRLTLSHAGRLFMSEHGAMAMEGLLMTRQPSHGLTLGPKDGGEDEEIKRMEWELRDDEAQCLIHLTADGLPSGQAALKCELKPDPTSPIEANRARIELRQAETGLLQLSGLLAHHQRLPLRLSPGEWIVKMQATGDGGQSFDWGIRITLDPATTK